MNEYQNAAESCISSIRTLQRRSLRRDILRYQKQQLVASIYNAPFQKNKYFLWHLTNLLELYSTRYEKVMIFGDFNKEAENKVMKDFLQKHTFYNMMKQNTCFKSDVGSCIDLLFTNSKFSFMKTSSSKTDLSDHPHMMYSILKINLRFLNQRN